MTTEVAQLPDVADQAVESHEAKKTPQESFAELRKAREDAERQTWQAKKELELMQKQMQSQLQQQKPTQPPEEDFDYRTLETEDFPDGKNLAKAFGAIDKKMSKYQQELVAKDHKIQALQFAVEHPDFKDIVTEANIQKYIKQDEDNDEAVQKAANPLSKAYRLIRKELEREGFKNKSAPVSAEQKKVDEREGKPVSGSLGVRSASITAIAQMSNSSMTKEIRAQLWKETQAAARKAPRR